MSVETENDSDHLTVMGRRTEVLLIRLLAFAALFQLVIAQLTYDGIPYALSMVTVSLISVALLVHTREDSIGTDKTPYLSHQVSRVIYGVTAIATGGWGLWYAIQTSAPVSSLVPIVMLGGFVVFMAYNQLS